MTIKTLADVKRALKMGATVKMTRHDWFPSGEGKNAGGVIGSGIVGSVRTVEVVQSNAVAFSPLAGKASRSWLYFPKASEVYGTPSGFGIKLDEKGACMEYEIINA